jgi:archaemetzincin
VGCNARLAKIICLILAILYSVACSTYKPEVSPANAVVPEVVVQPEVRSAMKKVVPFFSPMGKPKAYDWLASHNEPGQTFDEYLSSSPTKPSKDRQKIYILPLGTFNAEQKKAVAAAAGYLAVFFDLPVEQMPARTITVPYPNFRYNEYIHRRQLKTGYFLNDILPKLLPSDAAALIAFTNDDLYPDESMNYVFGQGSFDARVGIWSFSRLKERASYDLFLRRVLKIAAHETGHMFSMKHCTKYECLMSGTNYLGETDSRPIDGCPECMAKICWLSDILPKERYLRLADYCRRIGLNAEATEFDRKAKAVS